MELTTSEWSANHFQMLILPTLIPPVLHQDNLYSLTFFLLKLHQQIKVHALRCLHLVRSLQDYNNNTIQYNNTGPQEECAPVQEEQLRLRPPQPRQPELWRPGPRHRHGPLRRPQHSRESQYFLESKTFFGSSKYFLVSNIFFEFSNIFLEDQQIFF